MKVDIQLLHIVALLTCSTFLDAGYTHIAYAILLTCITFWLTRLRNNAKSASYLLAFTILGTIFKCHNTLQTYCDYAFIALAQKQMRIKIGAFAKFISLYIVQILFSNRSMLRVLYILVFSFFVGYDSYCEIYYEKAMPLKNAKNPYKLRSYSQLDIVLPPSIIVLPPKHDISESFVLSSIGASIFIVSLHDCIRYANFDGIKLIEEYQGFKNISTSLVKHNSSTNLSYCINSCMQTKSEVVTTVKCIDKNKHSYSQNRSYSATIKYLKSHDCALIMLRPKEPQSKLGSSLVNDCLIEITSCSLFHELLNLINGVNGHLELLESSIPSDKITLYKNAQLYSSILYYRLKDIDDFFKISVNKFKSHITNVDIYTVFKEIKFILEDFAKSKQIELVLNFTTLTPKAVLTDKPRLLQILVNSIYTILDNLTEGKISIYLRQEKPKLIDFVIVIESPENKKLVMLFEGIKSFESLAKESHSPYKNMEGIVFASTSAISLKLGMGMDFKKSDKNYEVHIFISDGFEALKSDEDSQKERKHTLTHASSHENNIPPTLKQSTVRKLNINICQTSQNATNKEEKINDTECDDRLEIAEEMTIAKSLVPLLTPEFKKSKIPTTRIPSSKTSKQHKGGTSSCTDLIAMQSHWVNDEADVYNVIIADDNDTNLFILKELLKSLKMTAIQAKNGFECLSIVRRYIETKKIYRIKIIFMDMQMPVMDGLEATRAIITSISTCKLKSIPIIGVSSSNNENDRHKFIKSGICEFISKPVTRAVLGHIITKYS